MGTSSSFEGQLDKKSLLPEDFEGQEQKTSKDWQNLKNQMSRYINGNGSSIRGIAKQYIKASGGTGNLLHNSQNGVRGISQISNLFLGIRSNGIYQTLQQFGIDYQGKSVDEVLSGLINYISDAAVSKDDIVAREASVQSLSRLYGYIEENGMEIESLNSMPQELMQETICIFVEKYIWGKLLKDLEKRLEKYSNDPKKSVEIEGEIQVYIRNVVRSEFDSSSIKGAVGQESIIEDSASMLYMQCYKVMEGSI